MNTFKSTLCFLLIAATLLACMPAGALRVGAANVPQAFDTESIQQKTGNNQGGQIRRRQVFHGKRKSLHKPSRQQLPQGNGRRSRIGGLHAVFRLREIRLLPVVWEKAEHPPERTHICRLLYGEYNGGRPVYGRRRPDMEKHIVSGASRRHHQNSKSAYNDCRVGRRHGRTGFGL